MVAAIGILCPGGNAAPHFHDLAGSWSRIHRLV